MKEVNKTEKKPKFWKRKVGILGRQIPVVALLLVLVGGLGSAVLITYYGVITQTVKVEQAVILNCEDSDCSEEVGSLGEEETTISEVYTLESNRNVDVPVKLVTKVLNENGVEELGITTRYIGTLELTTKDTADWSVNGIKAIVEYTIVGDTLLPKVVEGVIDGYELIYYKDKEDAQTVEKREANPQPAIQIASIVGDLPYTDDGNVQTDANYCQDPDDYEHCKGAKIWYVPSAALDNCNSGVCVIDWSQWNNFLYETDLIRFFMNGNGEIVIPAGEALDFQVETTFSNSNVGTYTITTEAQVQ